MSLGGKLAAAGGGSASGRSADNGNSSRAIGCGSGSGSGSDSDSGSGGARGESGGAEEFDRGGIRLFSTPEGFIAQAEAILPVRDIQTADGEARSTGAFPYNP